LKNEDRKKVKVVFEDRYGLQLKEEFQYARICKIVLKKQQTASPFSIKR